MELKRADMLYFPASVHTPTGKQKRGLNAHVLTRHEFTTTRGMLLSAAEESRRAILKSSEALTQQIKECKKLHADFAQFVARDPRKDLARILFRVAEKHGMELIRHPKEKRFLCIECNRAVEDVVKPMRKKGLEEPYMKALSEVTEWEKKIVSAGTNLHRAAVEFSTLNMGIPFSAEITQLLGQVGIALKAHEPKARGIATLWKGPAFDALVKQVDDSASSFSTLGTTEHKVILERALSSVRGKTIEHMEAQLLQSQTRDPVHTSILALYYSCEQVERAYGLLVGPERHQLIQSATEFALFHREKLTQYGKERVRTAIGQLGKDFERPDSMVAEVHRIISPSFNGFPLRPIAAAK